MVDAMRVQIIGALNQKKYQAGAKSLRFPGNEKYVRDDFVGWSKS